MRKSIATHRTPNVPSSEDSSGQSCEIPLIRGVTPHARAFEPRITHSLDFLTYTVPYGIGYEKAFPAHEALFPTGEVRSNISGYDHRLVLTHGSVSWHPRFPQHKICARFTGRDLWALRQAGLTPLDLLTFLLEHGGTITRMDFAVDYRGPSSPRDLRRASQEGRLKTPAKKGAQWESFDLGDGERTGNGTIYIGSNKSGRQLRCYDKAAQLNEPGPCTRIELVTREPYGNKLAKAMVKSDLAEAGKQAIRDYVTCDIDWFNQAVNGPSVYIETAPRQAHDTKGWLLGDVLKSFVREIERGAAEGDFDVYEAYDEALRRIRRGKSRAA